MRPSVTLCMIVKNEEQYIRNCLDAARAYVNEIVIVDTGSSDGTIAIAEEYGARVFPYAWNNHFAEARNYGLHRALGDWILVLDADEVIEKVDETLFREMLRNESIAGYYVTIRHLRSTSDERDVETDQVCRLFRRHTNIAYRGRIHEDIGMSLLIHFPQLQLYSSELNVVHYGYIKQVSLDRGKIERNQHLLQLAVNEEADRVYYQYALGVEYFLCEEFERAANQLAPLLSIVPPTAGYATDLAYKLAYACWRNQQPERALDACETGLIREPSNQELQELHGLLLLQLDRIEAAHHRFQMLERSLRASEHTRTRASYWQGVVEQLLGNWDKALVKYEQSISERYYFDQAISRWIDLSLLISPVQHVYQRIQAMLPEANLQSIFQHISPYLIKYRLGNELLPMLRALNSSQYSRTYVELVLYEAIILAQAGDISQARNQITRLVMHQPTVQNTVYAWALEQIEASRPQHSMDSLIADLKPFLSISPELSSLAISLSNGNWEQISLNLLDLTMYALMNLQAWVQLQTLWPIWFANNAGPIPALWRHPLLQSPLSVRQTILAASSKSSNHGASTCGGQLFIALLAFSTGDTRTSEHLLLQLKEQFPSRLEPSIALHIVHSGSDTWSAYLLLNDEII